MQIIQEIKKGVNKIDRYQDSILIAYRNGKRFDDNLFEETVNAGAFKENRHQILYKKCLAFRQADLPLFVDDENHLQKVHQEAMAALARKQREKKRKEWELQHPKKQEKLSSLEEKKLRQNWMLERVRRASADKWMVIYGKKIQEEHTAIISEQVYKRREYLKLLNRLKKRKKKSLNVIIEYRWELSQKRLSKIFKSEGWQLVDIDVGDKGCYLAKTACICGQLYPWGVILQRDGKIICFNVHHLAKHHVLSEEKAKIVERCFKQMQRDLFEVCDHTLEHPDYWSKKFTKVINDQNYMRRDTPQYQYLSFLRARGFAAPNAFNKRFIEQYQKKQKQTPLVYQRVIDYFQKYSREVGCISAIGNYLKNHPDIHHQQDVRAVWLIKLIEEKNIDHHEEFEKIKGDAMLRALPYEIAPLPIDEIKKYVHHSKMLKQTRKNQKNVLEPLGNIKSDEKESESKRKQRARNKAIIGKMIHTEGHRRRARG